MADREITPAEAVLREALIAPIDPERIRYWFDNPEIEYLLSVLPIDGTFVDIGAHIGTYTCTIAPHVKQVYAFEPNRLSYMFLLKSLDSLGINNVISFHGAVTHKPGVATYKDTHLTAHGSLGSPLESPITNYLVPVFTLDWLLYTGWINECHALKIDVNGFEAMVIQGGLKFIECFKPVIVYKMDFKKDYGAGLSCTTALEMLPHYSWFRFEEDGTLTPLVEGMVVRQHFNALAVPKEKV